MFCVSGVVLWMSLVLFGFWSVFSCMCVASFCFVLLICDFVFAECPCVCLCFWCVSVDVLCFLCVCYFWCWCLVNVLVCVGVSGVFLWMSFVCCRLCVLNWYKNQKNKGHSRKTAQKNKQKKMRKHKKDLQKTTKQAQGPIGRLAGGHPGQVPGIVFLWSFNCFFVCCCVYMVFVVVLSCLCFPFVAVFWFRGCCYWMPLSFFCCY